MRGYITLDRILWVIKNKFTTDHKMILYPDGSGRIIKSKGIGDPLLLWNNLEELDEYLDKIQKNKIIFEKESLWTLNKKNQKKILRW